MPKYELMLMLKICHNLFFRDTPGHKQKAGTDWEKETFLEVMQNVTDVFKQYFPPAGAIPFLPVIGNHDYFPRNQVGQDEDILQKVECL